MEVTLQKWGNSQGIRIPKTVTKEMKLSENQKFQLTFNEGKIILIPENDEKSLLKEMFENYDVDNKSNEYQWGQPYGKEVW